MFLGGNPFFLIMAAPIIPIILASLGSSILAFGFRDVWGALSAFRFFFFTPPIGIVSPRSPVVIRFLIFSTYAIGGLVFLLEITITLSIINGPLYGIVGLIADSLCALIYPIFISEGLLRPLKYRLEYLAEQKQ